MRYEFTDRAIAMIDKQLIEQYSHLKSIVSYDELNILQEVQTLYWNVNRIVRRIYFDLANNVYRDNLVKYKERALEEQWLNALLDAYDPVSKYVFTNEMDRKRARLVEALLASDIKVKEVEAALRSMSFMCRVYADRVTDEAVMQAYMDDGLEWVRWVAEIDDRTCRVCLDRDGRIYEINAVPPDPHPNCRCRRERADKWILK